MRDIMPFDELNRFKDELPIHFEDGKIRSKADEEDIIDELFELFLLSYSTGRNITEADLDTETHVTLDEVMDTVDEEVAGKTWKERVHEYFENGGTEADIVRIAETETHRITNKAAFVTAGKAGATKKVWHCLMLPTSRDSHIYLDGVEAPLDGEFYSINGGSTLFPGQWGIAEEDVNCLCWLTFKR